MIISLFESMIPYRRHIFSNDFPDPVAMMILVRWVTGGRCVQMGWEAGIMLHSSVTLVKLEIDMSVKRRNLGTPWQAPM